MPEQEKKKKLDKEEEKKKKKKKEDEEDEELEEIEKKLDGDDLGNILDDFTQTEEELLREHRQKVGE